MRYREGPAWLRDAVDAHGNSSDTAREDAHAARRDLSVLSMAKTGHIEQVEDSSAPARQALAAVAVSVILPQSTAISVTASQDELAGNVAAPASIARNMASTGSSSKQ